MSYFDDDVEISRYIKIDGVAMPETSVVINPEFNNVSEGGRLADNIDYEGYLVGVKITIELEYARLNKEHYDILFNATQKKYNEGLGFFFDIQVPHSQSPNGILKIRGYFQSTHKSNCVDTTMKHGLGDEYWLNGEKYDELHENVIFSFVQK